MRLGRTCKSVYAELCSLDCVDVLWPGFQGQPLETSYVASICGQRVFHELEALEKMDRFASSRFPELPRPVNFQNARRRVSRQRAVVSVVAEDLDDHQETSLATYGSCLRVLEATLDNSGLVSALEKRRGIFALCCLHALARRPLASRLDFEASSLKDDVAELVFYERGFLNPTTPLRTRDKLCRKAIPLETVATQVLGDSSMHNVTVSLPSPTSNERVDVNVPPSLQLLEAKVLTHNISGLKAPMLRLVTKDIHWSQR